MIFVNLFISIPIYTSISIHIIMAQEPRYQKAYNLPHRAVEQLKDLRETYGSDTASVVAGIELLHRTLKNRPGNEDLIRGL